MSTFPDTTPLASGVAAEPPGEPALRVRPARYPWRWAATAVVAVLLAMALNALITNPAWKWPVVAEYLFAPSILSALWLTVRLTAYGTVIGFALGTVLALMRLSRSPLLSGVSWTYVWAFRSIPLIVQLLFWYNLAILYDEISFGVPFGPSFYSVSTMELISPLTAAVLGLALHQAAYSAEIVRSGVLAVDQGQLEAAAALGIPRSRQIRRIILPQAMRTIMPTAANEIIGLFKGTSVVYIMALGELFYRVQVIYNRTGDVVPMLMVATIWYIVFTTLLSVVQYYVERHHAKGALRTLPPTPVQRLRRRAAALRGAFGRRTGAAGGGR
ncbi:amino acid ABC transporter permease [Marinitenerispora sediminis]|uniref:Amino acid ABC transporter permease n=1 Tax=Marinitenerispora sediminis TaxID=1931232 RepID=A0A368SZL5_9ACTN|nr:amino acid ABC transporter permease [Marinitenerispora sediminis]RCV48138.1 amino acid ABC transporter permease [Marinitenerispora sediminis]RCV50280.1 amino acid ABC transporter permease [Marinitenerispora sediminis]RCV51591.1 amino acid ABC transporter permease [Marinitenerispora sediminis]